MSLEKHDRIKKLIQDGKRSEARAELMALVRADPKDAEAWHLLAQALDDPEKRAYCLERAYTLQAAQPAPVEPGPVLPPTPLIAPTKPAPSGNAKVTNRVIGCLAILAVVVTCIGFASLGGSGGEMQPTPTATRDFPTDVEAVSMCRQFLEDGLKAPATARYPSRLTAKVTHQGKVFSVASYVDAENSFGALLRMNFVCKMEYQGNSYWKLLDLTTSEDD